VDIDIEEVAAKTPEKIRRHSCRSTVRLAHYEAMELGFFLYDDVKKARAAAEIMQQALHRASWARWRTLRNQSAGRRPRGDVVALRRKDW
jgi:succinyl-CoA synthetase beta subunit